MSVLQSLSVHGDGVMLNADALGVLDLYLEKYPISCPETHVFISATEVTRYERRSDEPVHIIPVKEI